MLLRAETIATVLLAACYVPYTKATPTTSYRVAGGMQWVDIQYAPSTFRVDGWAPLSGSYYVLIDESQRFFCSVSAETYSLEVDAHRVFSCAWRVIRP